MNASTDEYVDPRRPIDRYLDNYAENHRDPVNRVVQWICVPLIVWTVIALAWAVPVPAALGRPGLWAGLGMALALLFYWRLSRPLALSMSLAFVALGLLTFWLHGRLGTQGLVIAALSVFVLAWIAQLVGHSIEAKRPSFLTDLVTLLIGPLWLLSRLFRRLGLSY